MTSGWRSRISRILLTSGMPASSDMVGGIAARIQRLPSSSAGRNSLPSREPSKPLTSEKDQSDRDRDLAMLRATSAAPACRSRRSARTTMRLGLLDMLGQQQRGQARRHREGREQRADQRVAIGARHRTEDLAFDALHGEQRHEGRDGDRGGEEHGLVDLQRADQDDPQPVGPGRVARRIGRRASDRVPTVPPARCCSSCCRSSGLD